MNKFWLLVLAFPLAACQSPPAPMPPATPTTAAFPSGALVDLSHAYDAETVYWPTAEGFKLEKDFAGVTDKGYYYAANRFSTAEHGGTHIDAPVHFAEGRHAVEQIPLARLMGASVTVDVSRQCAGNPDYQIGVADFEQWEQTNGPLPRDAIVLLRTGFGARWPDREKYLGTSERGAAAVAKLHFPGLHPDAARWLVANRTVKAVGLDTPSIDFGQSTSYPTHRTLFEQNIPAFENVAHLDALPATGGFVIALPMKIRGGSGGPLRIVAIVPPGRSRK